MGEVDKYLKPLANDFMALLAANAGDQSHAAGIVLIAWMIESLRLGRMETTIRCMHGNLFDNAFSVQNALSDTKDTATLRSLWREIALVLHEDACLSRSGRVRDEPESLIYRKIALSAELPFPAEVDSAGSAALVSKGTGAKELSRSLRSACRLSGSSTPPRSFFRGSHFIYKRAHSGRLS
jgi:hypothetical protein